MVCIVRRDVRRYMRLCGDKQSSRPAVYAEGSTQICDCRSMDISQFFSQLTLEQYRIVRAHGVADRAASRAPLALPVRLIDRTSGKWLARN